MSVQDSEDSRNYTEPVSTRLTPQRKEQFEEWREENQLGSAEALRQLVADGLEEDNALDRGPLALSSFVAIVAFILLSLSGDNTGGWIIGGVYISGTFLWAFWPVVRNTVLSG